MRRVWATRVTLVGHSLGSAVVVRAAQQLDGQCQAIVSIEGNLTAHDALLTGQAAGHDDAEEFKASLAVQIDALVAAGEAPQSFAESVRAADAATMWALGRDVALQSRDDSFGHEFVQLTCPRLYRWSKATTPRPTQEFLRAHAVPHHELGIAHHWPWIVDPAVVAALITGP